MIECLPQTFLREGGSLEDLKAKWGINHKRGVLRPNLVSLKYDQIKSPFSEPLVRQCRGLILDSANNWALVARPFDKFFNLGEELAAKIDWQTARCQEKLDGSLMILYWFDGDWRVATSGTPDATGSVGHVNPDWNFQGLFWWVWNCQLMKRPAEKWREWTFLFELLTPYNRVVTKPVGNRIVFLSARSLDGEEEMVGGDEFPCETYHWEAVQEYPLRTMKDILLTFEKMNPLVQEGYVIVDGDLNRIKVKHPGYVALHHLKGDGFGPKRVLECIRMGETAEIVASFPEWKPDFDKMAHKYADLVGHLEAEYGRLKDIPLQKAFALEALKTRCPSALFALRSGKVQSIRGHLQQLNVESLLVTLETPTHEETV